MSANADLSFFGIHEEIILTRNGVWLSNGEEITHPGTVQVFSRSIFRSPNGYELRIGNEKKIIQVEDTLYFVKSIHGAPELGFTLYLTDGRRGDLAPESLHYTRGRLTCKVPNPNDGVLDEAKFLTAAYYEFLKHLKADQQGFYILIEGKTIRFED